MFKFVCEQMSVNKSIFKSLLFFFFGLFWFFCSSDLLLSGCLAVQCGNVSAISPSWLFNNVLESYGYGYFNPFTLLLPRFYIGVKPMLKMLLPIYIEF